MIAQLRGVVVQKNLADAVIDVNGVGYRVYFSSLTLSRLPEEGQQALDIRDNAVGHLPIVILGDRRITRAQIGSNAVPGIDRTVLHIHNEQDGLVQLEGKSRQREWPLAESLPPVASQSTTQRI